jgi:hypothetical protein
MKFIEINVTAFFISITTSRANNIVRSYFVQRYFQMHTSINKCDVFWCTALQLLQKICSNFFMKSMFENICYFQLFETRKNFGDIFMLSWKGKNIFSCAITRMFLTCILRMTCLFVVLWILCLSLEKYLDGAHLLFNGVVLVQNVVEIDNYRCEENTRCTLCVVYCTGSVQISLYFYWLCHRKKGQLANVNVMCREAKTLSIYGLSSLRTEVTCIWEKFRKCFFSLKMRNRKTNGTIRTCSSRAFQWMVMSVCFDNL